MEFPPKVPKAERSQENAKKQSLLGVLCEQFPDLKTQALVFTLLAGALTAHTARAEGGQSGSADANGKDQVEQVLGGITDAQFLEDFERDASRLVSGGHLEIQGASYERFLQTTTVNNTKAFSREGRGELPDVGTNILVGVEKTTYLEQRVTENSAHNAYTNKQDLLYVVPLSPDQVGIEGVSKFTQGSGVDKTDAIAEALQDAVMKSADTSNTAPVQAEHRAVTTDTEFHDERHAGKQRVIASYKVISETPPDPESGTGYIVKLEVHFVERVPEKI